MRLEMFTASEKIEQVNCVKSLVRELVFFWGIDVILLSYH